MLCAPGQFVSRALNTNSMNYELRTRESKQRFEMERNNRTGMAGRKGAMMLYSLKVPRPPPVPAG